VELAAENLALRQQLAVLEQRSKRPRLRKRHRIFWVWLSRRWNGWRSVLAIVQPETVLRWHQQGSRLYWRWKSQSGKVFSASVSYSATTCPRRPWPSTWFGIGSHRHRLGVLSLTIISET
jgi:hypothetical protein